MAYRNEFLFEALPGRTTAAAPCPCQRRGATSGGCGCHGAAAAASGDGEMADEIIKRVQTTRGRGGALTGSRLFWAGRDLLAAAATHADPAGRERLQQVGNDYVARGAQQWASGLANQIKRTLAEQGRGQGDRSGRNASWRNRVATALRDYLARNPLLPPEVQQRLETLISQASGKAGRDNHPGSRRAGQRRSQREADHLFEAPLGCSTCVAAHSSLLETEADEEWWRRVVAFFRPRRAPDPVRPPLPPATSPSRSQPGFPPPTRPVARPDAPRSPAAAATGGPPTWRAGDVMLSSPFQPTQKRIYRDSVEDLARAMKSPAWNWDAMRDKIMIDVANNIMDGHHRVVAARLAGVPIPPSALRRMPSVSALDPRPWNNVAVVSGRKPA